jgi:hypothetical protein
MIGRRLLATQMTADSNGIAANDPMTFTGTAEDTKGHFWQPRRERALFHAA